MNIPPGNNSVFNWIYNKTIREHLPRKLGVFNCVSVQVPRLLDMHTTFPEYENELINAIRSVVEAGDDVNIVGGGYGVSTVWAARKSQTGDINVFEPSNTIDIIRQTLSLNCSDRTNINLHQAAVGPVIENYGNLGEYRQLTAKNLPNANVWILDCEGAEKQIFPTNRRPDSIIVESHGFLDSSTEYLIDSLESMGYTIESVRTVHIQNGIDVITAKLQD